MVCFEGTAMTTSSVIDTMKFFHRCSQNWGYGNKKNREISDADISKISEVYHAWRTVNGKYQNVKGFCKAVKITEVEKSDYVLAPGRDVGTDYVEENDEIFEEKMAQAIDELATQFKLSKELEDRIRKKILKISDLK